MRELLHLLIGPIVAQIETLTQDVARRVALGAALVVVLVAAVGFALAALTLWLATLFGPIYACLVVTGILLLVALVVWMISRTPRRHDPAPVRTPVNQAALVGVAASLAPLVLRHRTLSAAMALGAIGFLAFREHQSGPRPLPPRQLPPPGRETRV